MVVMKSLANGRLSKKYLLVSCVLVFFLNATLSAKTTNVWDLEPFYLNDLKGNKRELADWKGKVIMLNFWASWCSPCLQEMPRFIGFQEKYEDRGLQIIGIGVDAINKLKNVKRTLAVNYPILVLDPNRSPTFMSKWGNSDGFIPYTVIISKTGRVKYIHRGSLNKEEFNENVLPLLDSLPRL